MTGKNNLCFRCLVDDMGDEELSAVLRDGIASLPDHLRVDDTSYQERLAACRSCEYLTNGLCRFCGCFVEMRALKRTGTCPCPGGSRWEK